MKVHPQEVVAQINVTPVQLPGHLNFIHAVSACALQAHDIALGDPIALAHGHNHHMHGPATDGKLKDATPPIEGRRTYTKHHH